VKKKGEGNRQPGGEKRPTTKKKKGTTPIAWAKEKGAIQIPLTHNAHTTRKKRKSPSLPIKEGKTYLHPLSPGDGPRKKKGKGDGRRDPAFHVLAGKGTNEFPVRLCEKKNG